MDDYEGVTHAGIAVVATDTGRVLLAQRSFDETDVSDVAETWEFPGGSLDEGETPLEGATREFGEELGLPLPAGEVTDGWRGGDDPETGHYQGFVYTVPTEFDLSDWSATKEVQNSAWFDSSAVQKLESDGLMRPEIVATMNWDLIFGVSGNEESMSEPDFGTEDIPHVELKVHGVLAPEDTESGDGRGFSAGAMTARPYRLPFSWQKSAVGGHDGSVVVGSVDRLMRKDGLIHWEGTLMCTSEADELTELVAFFGQFGVSVDGDRGSLDSGRSEKTGITWFDAVRAAGLTAVAIPAFSEAYVALGPHPEMPEVDAETGSGDALAASALAVSDIVTFKRGPGWITDPGATSRIHDYWTKKGQPGYAKIGWGTPGDFTRAKALIGEKIAKNSPEKMRYLNQIIAQWHHDALGYWPGDLDKPGNKTTAEARAERKARHSSAGLEDDIEAAEQWEAVLVSSVSGNRVLPPLSYFSRHPDTDALVIEEPDENGLRRTYGYAGEWGVCHIGIDGRCVEVPEDPTGGDFSHFHLGRTKTGAGYINTGLITYGIAHRGADQILSETPTQAHFDDLSHAWAAVVLGTDERGMWFSGVVLPTVEEKWLTAIEASGQVSGEWKYGALRTLLTVNVPGFPVVRSSAEYDAEGNVVALAASALTAAYKVAEPPEDAYCMYEACSEHATWGVWQNPTFAHLFCAEHAPVAQAETDYRCPEEAVSAADRMAALAYDYQMARFAALKGQWV